MKVLQLKRPHDQEVFAQKMKASSTVEEYRRWQCLYLISGYQVDAPFIADVTQLSVHSIYKLVQTFNRKGEKGIALQGRGGRRRYLLPLEQEKALMKELSEKAKSGQILQATDIKREVEAKVGKEVSDDYLWDLLKRHSWVKQTPRPEHPQKDKKAQERFKKNSERIWLPPTSPLQQ